MPKRILAVDDDEKVLLVLNGSLTRLGADYEVVTARDGQEALEKFQAAPFDLLITDLRMPGMDGIALTEAVLRLAPQASVIWMTAYGRRDADAQRLAVRRCLQKPLDITEIREAALEALRSRPAAASLTSRPQVLVLEDDPQDAIALYQALNKGYYVKITMLLDEALNSLRRETFEWIITTMSLETLNGLDFISRARQLSPATRILLLRPPASPGLSAQVKALGGVTLSELMHYPEQAPLLLQALEHFSPYRLLLVAPEPTTTVVAPALAAQGWRFWSATTLAQAGQWLAQRRFDVVIYDLRLEPARSWAWLEDYVLRLRQWGSRLIVLLDGPHQRQCCRQLGVDGCLEQADPVAVDELARLVKQVLQPSDHLLEPGIPGSQIVGSDDEQ